MRPANRRLRRLPVPADDRTDINTLLVIQQVNRNPALTDQLMRLLDMGLFDGGQHLQLHRGIAPVKPQPRRQVDTHLPVGAGNGHRKRIFINAGTQPHLDGVDLPGFEQHPRCRRGQGHRRRLRTPQRRRHLKPQDIFN